MTLKKVITITLITLALCIGASINASNDHRIGGQAMYGEKR